MPKEGIDELKYIFLAATIVFIIGIRDDLIPMRPIYKLINQLIPTLLVIFFYDVTIYSLYGIAGSWEFPILVKIVVTVFTVIVITNSFNLIDGIDGLAGSIAIIASSVLGIWFMMINHIYLSALCFSLVGVCVGFLYYNWSPSKIFMGDTGALMIGFLLSCLIIIFLNENAALKMAHYAKLENPITFAISIVMLPLIDTLRVFIIRVRKGVSPFFPDNNHLHHMLLSKGYSHSKTVMVLLTVNLSAVGFAVFSSTLSDRITLPVLLALVVLFVLLISRNVRADKTINHSLETQA